MLPQRVLTKLGRSGRDARKRTSRTVNARARDATEELRKRYNLRSTADHDMRLTVTTTSLVHSSRARRSVTMSTTAATDVDEGSSEGDRTPVQPRSPSSTPADELAAPSHASSSAATVVGDTGRHTGSDDVSREQHDSDTRDETDCARAFMRLLEDDRDPDLVAAKRAMHLVRHGHLRKAAQTLHSTATMADLRQPAAQQEMRRLHPALPASSVLPNLPADAPQMILEDDETLRRIIQRSNNGASSGPSGWGGNIDRLSAGTGVQFEPRPRVQFA
jgi:hypothetical protein